jgi:hypothetical protein
VDVELLRRPRWEDRDFLVDEFHVAKVVGDPLDPGGVRAVEVRRVPELPFVLPRRGLIADHESREEAADRRMIAASRELMDRVCSDQ